MLDTLKVNLTDNPLKNILIMAPLLDETGQQSTVYYNGTRYWYNAECFDQPLEDGFEKVGEVDRVNNQEYPSEEFGGTRLDSGQEIYANREDASKIYIKYDSGYTVFERQ